MPTRKRPRVTDGVQYVSQARVARHLGMSRSAVVNWVKRHEGYPEPVAHVDEQVPLWAPEQLPDWEKWFEFNTSPAQRARWSGEIAPKR